MGNGPVCQADCKQVDKCCVDESASGYKLIVEGHEEVDLTALLQTEKFDFEPAEDRPAIGSRKRDPFTVKLNRVGPNWRTLGLLVIPDDSRAHLLIDEILQQSLISDWNSSVEEGRQVLPGDRITGVNGCVSSSEELLSLIQVHGEGSELVLHIESG
eukprot:TRINITY_DN29480_c0_g1_i1.p1 TRINITY_DN29480_c0_g1~~TRINITY_DN29480_c0_g1_i1.p1  ORF type:complete len:157 (-),score=27.72 TRINITY_DN29480_c0_g1_i1:73-543(-)